MDVVYSQLTGELLCLAMKWLSITLLIFRTGFFTNSSCKEIVMLPGDYIIWYRKDGIAHSLRITSGLNDARDAWDYCANKYDMISTRP